jgi:pilus assembly protein CpaB
MLLRLIVINLIAVVAVVGLLAYRITAPIGRPVAVAAIETAIPRLKNDSPLTDHSLRAGTLVRDEDVTSMSTLRDRFPANANDQPENRAGLRGTLIANAMGAGGTITFAEPRHPRDRRFLATVRQPDTATRSAGVDAITGASGLIGPGERVGVILARELDNNNIALFRGAVDSALSRRGKPFGVRIQVARGDQRNEVTFE